MSDAERIRAAGWTQGSVLTGGDWAGEVGLAVGATYLLTSHPCDVVSERFDRDPEVEAMAIEEVDRLDGNFTFGKNPRRLHFAVGDRAFEVRVDQRLTFDRKALSEQTPLLTISEAERRLLAAWLGSRYTRPAFADEFNRRMAPARKAIEKALRTKGSRVSGIWVATSLEELPPEMDYRVSMVFAMEAIDFGSPEAFAVASEGAEEVGAAISKLEGISLALLEVESEEEITLEAVRTYARWDWDAMSFRDDDASFPPAT